MKVRTIIVDDEVLSRRGLEIRTRELPDFNQRKEWVFFPLP